MITLKLQLPYDRLCSYLKITREDMDTKHNHDQL
jgi:hypothetical protein